MQKTDQSDESDESNAWSVSSLSNKVQSSWKESNEKKQQSKQTRDKQGGLKVRSIEIEKWAEARSRNVDIPERDRPPESHHNPRRTQRNSATQQFRVRNQSHSELDALFTTWFFVPDVNNGFQGDLVACPTTLKVIRIEVKRGIDIVLWSLLTRLFVLPICLDNAELMRAINGCGDNARVLPCRGVRAVGW